MVNRYSIDDRASIAAEALEAIWRQLRQIEPRIPPAVMATLSDEPSIRRAGHFVWSRWKAKSRRGAHEVAVHPVLFDHPKDLLATLLHEAAHAILHEEGKAGGMGCGGYYHRVEFRNVCQELGLACKFLNCRYGWTVTHWPREGISDRYRALLRRMTEILPSGTGDKKPSRLKGTRTPKPGHTIMVCACPDGKRTIYVKQSVLAEGGILCAFCNAEFKPLSHSTSQD